MNEIENKIEDFLTQKMVQANLKKIIIKKYYKRTEEESEQLINFLKNIEFFKNKTFLLLNDYFEIGNRLQFFKCQKTENVFNFGDFGEFFYIILKGSVSINVPNQKI